jgi:hypothetical protein
VALTHGVPGTELRLIGDDEPIVVSNHPASTFSPCEMRELLLRHPRPEALSRFLSTATLELGGGLGHLGGALFAASTPHGLDERWIATTLYWRDVRDELVAIDTGPDDDALHATVKRDRELAVTLARLTATDRRHANLLHRVATQLAGTLAVHELFIESGVPGTVRR